MIDDERLGGNPRGCVNGVTTQTKARQFFPDFW